MRVSSGMCLHRVCARGHVCIACWGVCGPRAVRMHLSVCGVVCMGMCIGVLVHVCVCAWTCTRPCMCVHMDVC